MVLNKCLINQNFHNHYLLFSNLYSLIVLYLTHFLFFFFFIFFLFFIEEKDEKDEKEKEKEKDLSLLDKLKVEDNFKETNMTNKHKESSSSSISSRVSRVYVKKNQNFKITASRTKVTKKTKDKNMMKI